MSALRETTTPMAGAPGGAPLTGRSPQARRPTAKRPVGAAGQARRSMQRDLARREASLRINRRVSGASAGIDRPPLVTDRAPAPRQRTSPAPVPASRPVDHAQAAPAVRAQAAPAVRAQAAPVPPVAAPRPSQPASARPAPAPTGRRAPARARQAAPAQPRQTVAAQRAAAPAHRPTAAVRPMARPSTPGLPAGAPIQALRSVRQNVRGRFARATTTQAPAPAPYGIDVGAVGVGGAAATAPAPTPVGTPARPILIALPGGAQDAAPGRTRRLSNPAVLLMAMVLLVVTIGTVIGLQIRMTQVNEQMGADLAKITTLQQGNTALKERIGRQVGASRVNSAIAADGIIEPDVVDLRFVSVGDRAKTAEKAARALKAAPAAPTVAEEAAAKAAAEAAAATTTVAPVAGAAVAGSSADSGTAAAEAQAAAAAPAAGAAAAGVTP